MTEKQKREIEEALKNGHEIKVQKKAGQWKITYSGSTNPHYNPAEKFCHVFVGEVLR